MSSSTSLISCVCFCLSIRGKLLILDLIRVDMSKMSNEQQRRTLTFVVYFSSVFLLLLFKGCF